MPPPLLLRHRLFDGMFHNLHRTETFCISLLVFKCRRRLLITSSRLLDVIKLMEGFILSYLVFPSALSLYDRPGKGIACLEVLERILQPEVLPGLAEEAL